MDGEFPDLTDVKAKVSKSPPRRGPHWLSDCQTDSHAEPRPNLYNAMLPLRDDPRVNDLFAYDEMLRAVILQNPVPGTVLDPAEIGVFQPRPVRDADVSLL